MAVGETHHFRIADFYVRLVFKESTYNNMGLLPSLEPFRIDAPKGEDPLFQLTVDDELSPRPQAERERIRTFDTGNGDTIVDLLSNGGYQYIIKNLDNANCSLLITDKDFMDCMCALNGNYNMRCFGLNNALMLVYAFASSKQQTLLIHASLVRQKGWGYAFIAKSGTGKSTQVSSWLRYLPDCDLMNDDNPIVRILNGEAWVYGSPWSGKTPCYRNVKARLGAITRIERDVKNSVEKLQPVEAFASLLPACSTMKWDKNIFNHICNNITLLIETTGCFTLHCLPNREAAEICSQSIRIN